MGLYSFGVRLALFPSLSLYSIIVRVAFPAFARIQTDPLRVREAMGRLLGLITLMAFPLATGVALTSPVFVPLLFGEKWRPVVPVLQMLSFAGATNLMQSVLSSVASSVGRPQISVRASVLRLAVVSLAVPATMWYGIEGSAAAVLVSSVCSCLFLLVQVTRFLGTSAARYGPVLLTPIVSSAAMAAAILWIRPWVSNWSGVLQLLTMVGVGATIYITMALALDRRGSTGMASELMSVLRPNRAGRGA
jgi:O-antigen/teichoic acid export membrane protein